MAPQTPTKANRRRPTDLEWSDLGMSNFNHAIDDGFEEALRTSRVYGQHSAWNFCGYVWFEDNEFHEEVWHYNEYQTTISDSNLRELMEAVNEEWGAE